MNICWLNQNESEKFYFIIIFILNIIKEKNIYNLLNYTLIILSRLFVSLNHNIN